MRLHPADVEAIARRTADLLSDRGLPAAGFVNTATVARALSVSDEWVRDHAAELGAVKLADGGGVLRFDAARVRGWLDRRRVASPVERRRRTPGRPRGAGWASDVLPLPREAA